MSARQRQSERVDVQPLAEVRTIACMLSTLDSPQ